MSGVWSARRASGWLLGAGLLTALLGGCKGFLNPYPPAQVISETTFDPSLGIDLSKMTVTPSGLYYEDIVVGDSTEVAVTDTLLADLTGWLSDGTQVLSGTGVGVVVAQVIPGLAEGLIGMKLGGERKLIVPSSLGWGDVGNGAGVPGGAIIVFDVTVTKIGGVDVTSGTGTGATGG